MLLEIKTVQDYEDALDEIQDLMDLRPHPDSYDGIYLDDLLDAVEDYEDKFYPMGYDY